MKPYEPQPVGETRVRFYETHRGENNEAIPGAWIRKWHKSVFVPVWDLILVADKLVDLYEEYQQEQETINND